jgi:hypothetical protein
MSNSTEQSIESVRDEIAGLLGWELYGSSWRFNGALYGRIHPIPSTLDGVAALWPKGWAWIRYGCVWSANAASRGGFGNYAHTEDTGDELADRTRLLLAVLKAEKANG